MSKSRGYCFTINNYTFEDLYMMIQLPCDYIVFGFEIGEEGTPHIQGYCFFQNARSFKVMREYVPRGHIEKAKGNPRQNRNYCIEDGDWFEFGDFPQKGKRTDLDDLIKYIQEGHTKKEIQVAFPKQYFLYNKRISEVAKPEEPKEHKLYIIPESEKYNYTGAFIDIDLDTYLDEEVLVMHAYKTFDVFGWYKGFAPRIRRGYEVIKIDPTVICIYFTSQEERNYLVKKYIDIIDGIQEADEQPKEIQQKELKKRSNYKGS